MARLMRSVAKDISKDLTSRLKVERSSEGDRLLTLLSKMIAKELTRQLLQEARKDPEGVRAIFSNSRDPGKGTKGFEKVEGKLTKIIEKGLKHSVDDRDDDDDDVKGGGPFPNLKYARSKYKNVESILKYIETKDDKAGGVKLVIMNFND